MELLADGSLVSSSQNLHLFAFKPERTNSDYESRVSKTSHGASHERACSAIIVFPRLIRVKGNFFVSSARLFFFGAPRIEIDGTPVKLQRRKAVALLAYLSVGLQVVERDEAATMFWPELDRERGRAALRQILWEIGGTPARGLLVIEREQIRFDERGKAWIDVGEFRCRVRAALTPDDAMPDFDDVENLREAVDLYGNGFLAGFSVRDSLGFDEWQTAQTESLRADYVRALEKLTEAHGARGQITDAIKAARRLVTLDPLHEAAHRRLMLLYAHSGSRAAALRQFEQCARALSTELDERPRPETLELYEAIKRGTEQKLSIEDALSSEDATGERAQAASPRGRGEAAKARDVSATQFIQSSAANGGETKATSARHAPDADIASKSEIASAARRLPSAATPFVGRARELAEICDRLREADCRLLTLTGLGGVGKTRLALRAAEACGEHFPDGVFFVSCAAVNTRPMLLAAIAEALGAARLNGAEGNLQAGLFELLKDKRALLALDNFEHLIDATDLLAQLLDATAHLKLLVTSRERLRLSREWVIEVRGMDFPPAEAHAKKADYETYKSYNAVQLFAQTARRVNSGFQLTAEALLPVARICRAVEGMPLAVELAAAWTRTLSCAQIAAEIESSLDLLTAAWRDFPSRHRNMRAVLDYSWRTLDAHEQQAFRRLAVFPHDFDATAARRVAHAPLSTLASLVDKSLMRRSGDGEASRFSFHELIRQFIVEKLNELPREANATRDAHCHYYAALIKRCDTLASTGCGALLATEIENLRAGWNRAIETGATSAIALYADAIFRFYDLKGLFDEGLKTFERAAYRCASATDKETLVLRSKLLARQGAFTAHLGMNERAAEFLHEALALLDDAGAGDEDLPEERANCLSRLGMVIYHLGREAEAKILLHESLAIYRSIADRHGTMDALAKLAYLAGEAKEYDEAERLLEESLALSRAHGTPQELVNALNDLGYALYLAGKHPRARLLLEESLALSEAISYRKGTAATLDNLGCVAEAVGDFAGAARRFRHALAVAVEIRAAPLALDVLKGLASLMSKNAREIRRAAEVFRFVIAHPATWKTTREEATILLREIEETNSLDESFAGKQQSLEAVAAEVLQGTIN